MSGQTGGWLGSVAPLCVVFTLTATRSRLHAQGVTQRYGPLGRVAVAGGPGRPRGAPRLYIGARTACGVSLAAAAAAEPRGRDAGAAARGLRGGHGGGGGGGKEVNLSVNL